MKYNRNSLRRSLLIIVVFCLSSSVTGLSQDTDIFKERRDKFAALLEGGIAIIQSTEKNQDNLLEFYVPNSDNHDFIFLTGLETHNATLILCPGSEEYPEILYINGDHDDIRRRTGLQHIFDPDNLLPDLSNAYSDYSLLRYTQRRFKPLPSEISRVLYNNGSNKIIYFNFPRFINLAERPPKRMEFIHNIQYYSPKYEIRDASDILDKLRMYHDDYGIEQLREAALISGEAMIECMKSTEPGMTEAQLKAVFTFVSHFSGAKSFGFPTTVRSGPRQYEEHFPDESKALKDGDLITIDAGVEINHYSADIQRTFPVSGKFSPEQRKAYLILKKAQEACIELVRPGVTMKDLQEKAMQVLNEEGGYGQYFRWGTSHFLGMEVHDHGNNLIPFKPGIAITVEPGIVMPDFSIVLEDDIVCTEDGYEWLTRFIPREIDDIEKVMKEEGIGKIYKKR
ncbi:aminopeptidase P N-terminal domain-containing protein [candidate division KSB1 bacterium]